MSISSIRPTAPTPVRTTSTTPAQVCLPGQPCPPTTTPAAPTTSSPSQVCLPGQPCPPTSTPAQVCLPGQPCPPTATSGTSGFSMQSLSTMASGFMSWIDKEWQALLKLFTSGTSTAPSSPSAPSSNDQRARVAGAPLFSASNFTQQVLQSSKPMVVEFYAPWCPHCQRMAPIVGPVVNQDASQMGFGQVNTDVDAALMKQYGVTEVPTYVAFKNGQVVGKLAGDQTAASLQAWMKSSGVIS